MTHPGVGPLTALGLRADHWNLGTFSTWQADRQLRGMIPSEDSARASSRIGAHQQAGQFLTALLAVEAPSGQHGATQTGDVGTFTWRCVGTRAAWLVVKPSKWFFGRIPHRRYGVNHDLGPVSDHRFTSSKPAFITTREPGGD